VHIRIPTICGLLALFTLTVTGQAGRNPIGYCVGLKGLELAKSAGLNSAPPRSLRSPTPTSKPPSRG
jgi:hypothetical protein